ncbi:MAG: hypothetical protein HKN68_15610, partial [Saprospiraceae bacterium]|nr:hypothetical protein [Saprospiraceae bacterium]
IPQLDDHVEIRNGKLNYPVLDQSSFKISEAGIYNYICGSIMIHNLANIMTEKNVFIINSGKIIIDGIWEAKNTESNSFINKNKGEITIRNGGLLDIKN